MTFKIHKGKVTLDIVDKLYAENRTQRNSSRKSGRLSVVEDINQHDEDLQQPEMETIVTEVDELIDDIGISGNKSAPIEASKASVIADNPDSHFSPPVTPHETTIPLPITIITSSSMDKTINGSPHIPVVSTLEYDGVAYGTGDYSGSDAITMSSETPKQDTQKILVESEFLFGHNIKKLVKISTVNLTVEIIAMSIKETCQLSQNINQLLLTFHDPDVDEFVVLDDYSLNDFLKLSKKVIHLQNVAPLPPVPIEVPNDNTLETSDPTVSVENSSKMNPVSTPVDIVTPLVMEEDNNRISKETISNKNKQHINANRVKINTINFSSTNTVNWFRSKLLAENGGIIFTLLNMADDNLFDIISSNCEQADSVMWQTISDFPPLRSRVVSLNGVYIDDLDRSQQIALLRQKHRPFIFEFEINEQSSEEFSPMVNNRNNITSPTTIKFALFWSKYSSSHASKLRKQIDKILDDYHTCDWEEAKKMGTGLPQTTIISLYKYIEQEMQRLDLFNPKRARGEGFPPEISESQLASIRGHIETMIFKQIMVVTKSKLWPFFQEPLSSYEYDEEMDGNGEKINIFSINKQFNVPSIEELYGLPVSGTIATNTFKMPSNQQVKLHIELSTEHSLAVKLAFLRFVTLEILGVQAGDVNSSTTHTEGNEDGKDNDKLILQEMKFPSMMETISHILADRNHIVFQEEWYVAIRALHQIDTLETPGEMMHRLKIVVDLITRALEKYINRPTSRVLKCQHLGRHNYHRVHPHPSSDLLFCPGCNHCHFLTPHKENFTISSQEITTGTIVDWQQRFGRVNAAYSCCNYDLKQEEHSTSGSRKQITGDDLLPGIVFALIQANPTNIDCLIWLCAEFRHPSLNIGEEAYCLASVSSALEFVKNASYKSLDVIPRVLYDHFLVRYANTLKLMLACKQGDLPLVKHLLNEGADVNGLSPDQIDTPLTACIRFRQHSIFHYLLFQQTVMPIAVDATVHLYRGPHERSTALHIATKQGEVTMVLMLLAAGANRYLVDEEGRSALSIAMDQEQDMFSKEDDRLHSGKDLDQKLHVESPYSYSYSLLHTILLADVYQVNIVDMILRKDPLAERLLAGLILQGVDIHRYHSAEQCQALCDTTKQQMHMYITPLIATVLTENILLLKMLLSIPSVQVSTEGKEETFFGDFDNPVDMPNSLGETALLVCVEKCLVTPSETLLAIAAILLRAQANRYHEDSFGRSAVNVLGSISSIVSGHTIVPVYSNTTSDTLDHLDRNHNPFAAEADDIHASTNVRNKDTEKESVSFLFPSGALSYYRDIYPDICYPNPSTHEVTAAPSSPVMRVSYAAVSPATDGNSDSDGFNIVPHLFHSTSMSTTSPSPEAVIQESFMQQEDMVSFLQSLILQDPLKSTASPIYEYARHHDYAAVRGLLLQAIDINAACPKKGYSALISAVYNRDVSMIRLILRSAQIALATCPLSEVWTPIFYDVIKATTMVTSIDNGYTEDNSALVLPSLKSYFPKTYTFTNPLKLDQSGRGGMTALHYAAQLGLTTVIGLLLAHGANRTAMNAQQHAAVDISVANGHMDTANVLRFDPARVSICLAAKHGDWLVLKALLLQGIDINTVKEHHHPNKGRHFELDTPLIAAVSHGQYDLVKRLLMELSVYAGQEACDTDMVIYRPVLDINQVNTIGQSALIYAAAKGDENLVLLLLKHGADRYIRDVSGHDAVHWAMAQEHVAIAMILRHDPDLIYVHDLIRKNDYEAVVAMFKQGVDVNLHRERLFVPSTFTQPEEDYYFSSSSYTSCSIPTTSSDTTVNSQHVTFQKRRLSAPTIARIDALQEYARMFIPGETPLMVAARYARIDVLQLLFKAPNVDIDAVDDINGWTALFHAAEQGHEEVVKFLLSKKANRKIEDCLGRCARDIALQYQHEAIAAMIDADPVHVHIHDTCQHGLLMLTIGLLKQGCPPVYRDERPGMFRQTPLMAAASGGQLDIIRMLLRYPSVYEGRDDQDTKGQTALMRAAAAGHLDATAVLLNAGCDRNIQDQQGLTARDHAARHSFSVMFQFMSQTMVR